MSRLQRESNTRNEIPVGILSFGRTSDFRMDEMAEPILYPRFARSRIEEMLNDTPVVLIHGPRQCGKKEMKMGIDESIEKEIVRRILSVATPDKIILFGSAANGQMTIDSDIDLLIVEPDPGDRRKESVRIDATLSGLGYPFDIIVITSEWFEVSKNIIGGIAYPANKYGRVIYEAA